MRGNSTRRQGGVWCICITLALAGLNVGSAWGATPDRTTVPSRTTRDRDQLDEAFSPAPGDPFLGGPDPGQRSSVLPPYQFHPDQPAEALSGESTYQVDRVAVTGVTVFDSQAIAALTTSDQNRHLSFRQMLSLRDALTMKYVNAGYVTSGATLEGLDAGVLTISVHEGALKEIQVTTEGRLREEFVAAYLEGFGPTTPVNILDLEERLQIFQQLSHVERVDAQLLPGDERGESVLQVQPVESRMIRMRTEVSNQLSPAVGEVQGIVSLDVLNLTGRTDDLYFAYRGAEGIDEFDGEYNFPLGAGGARMALYAFGADSDIVSKPFDDLDISADTWTAGARLQLPLSRSVSGNTSLIASAEWRRSETYLLGSGFSFIEGPDDGVAEMAIVRTGLEHLRRDQKNVIYGLLELSFGLDAFGATTSSDGGIPDGEFVKLRLQSQWARRLDLLNSQAIFRLDGQLTNDPLFGLEQFPIGGRWSVRGYRENTLIRDNVIIGSAEWRVPIVRGARWVSRLELRPFFDWSYSTNRNRQELRRNTLASVGVGLYWSPIDRLQAEVYWGEQLRTVDYPGEYDLQDDGIHFRFTWDAR